MFSLRSLFKRRPETETAHTLYAQTILAARSPVFFTELGVPDTPEGRFEILALMAFLLLRRLKIEAAAKDISQAYFDIMFDDIDSNLRELGVGDISVGKKVKKLAASFYGRIKAYEDAFAAAEAGALHAALSRHPYRNVTPAAAQVDRLAEYVRIADAHLAAQSTEGFIAGQVSFPKIDGGAEQNGK